MYIENEYHRGEIFYISDDGEATGSEQGGDRPGLIVSNDVGNKHAPIVEVVYLTTVNKKMMPTHVKIKSSPIPSVALCEQIETVYKRRIGKYMAQATVDEMKRVDKALAVSIGLGGNMKMDQYVKEWVKAMKGPDQVEKKEPEIQTEAQPEPIQETDNRKELERIKELEKELIRVEAERDVFQKLYKEQLATS